jgi:hypothetical protein
MIAGIQVRPICKVQDCKEPAQVYSKVSMNSEKGFTYLKTCCRHNYSHLQNQKIKASE